jgi:hypothetical protein
MLSWNPRGLNDPAKRDSVRDLIDSLRVNLVFLQGTKMAELMGLSLINALAHRLMGVYLPVEETHGGILLAWDSSVMYISTVSFAVMEEVRYVDDTSPTYL